VRKNPNGSVKPMPLGKLLQKLLGLYKLTARLTLRADKFEDYLVGHVHQRFRQGSRTAIGSERCT
jgi:hypothetical protein